ncbi:MAG: transposase [Anaeromyxobacter sp.]
MSKPGQRERAGCLAHVRRYFFDAQSVRRPRRQSQAMGGLHPGMSTGWSAPALDADPRSAPPSISEMRQTKSKAIMDAFHAWLLTEQGRHLPRGAMGEAINYTLGQWDELNLFLTDPHLPIDNNASERALRVAALGRKNFLFVGHGSRRREPGRPLLAHRHLPR